MFKRRHTAMHIRLGRSGSMYIAGMAVVFIVAVSTQTNLLFWIFGALLAAFFIAVGLPWWMLKKIDIERMIDQPTVAGRRGAIGYTLKSKHRYLPVFGLVIREDWSEDDAASPLSGDAPAISGAPHAWIMHVGPGMRKHCEAPCFPKRRGLIQFKQMVLECGFPFEVFRCCRMIEQASEMLVYPSVWPLDRRSLKRTLQVDPIGGRQAMRAGLGQEFFGLRQYRPGDPLKRVDWKRTAKTGQLVSREMTQPSAARLIIGLDLLVNSKQPLDDPAIERAICLTASIINDALLQGVDTGLVVLGLPCEPLPARSGHRHRKRLFETLATLDITARNNAAVMFDHPPSMVIKPGNATPLWREAQVWHVGGDSLEHWRTPGENDIAPMLQHNPNTTQSRHQSTGPARRSELPTARRHNGYRLTQAGEE